MKFHAQKRLSPRRVTEAIDNSVALTRTEKVLTDGKYCSVCSESSEKQSHVSSSEVASDHADVYTVCGYEIVPKPGQVAVPVISPNGGTFNGSQTVTITCATEGATIYNITEGTAPSTSSTKYTTAFSISATSTVKAIAVKSRMVDSEAATATFAKKSSGFFQWWKLWTYYSDINRPLNRRL